MIKMNQWKKYLNNKLMIVKATNSNINSHKNN